MTEKTEKEIAEIEAIRKKEFIERTSLQAMQIAATLLPHRVENLPTLSNNAFEFELQKLTNHLMLVHRKIVAEIDPAFDLEAQLYGNVERLQGYILGENKRSG